MVAQPAVLEPYDAVVLLSFGGPETADQVMPFLRSVTAGRGIPEDRLELVAGHYLARGGRSPINAENRSLRAELTRQLRSRRIEVPVLWGNRHTSPTVSEAFAQARSLGVRQMVAIPTSAYSGFASCRQYWMDISAAIEDTGGPAGLSVDRVRRYAHHPGFSRTVARLTVTAIQDLATVPHLLFVTHSIPVSMDAGSGLPEIGDGHRYTREHRLLAEGVVAEVSRMLPRPDWDLVFCSRSGPPGQPWLEPDICDHLATLAARGVRSVVVVPLGFVADHMEVVYDLDEQAAAVAAELGMDFVRVPTVRSDPGFVSGLVDLLVERAARARGEPVVAPVWPSGPVAGDSCPADCCRPPAGRPSLGRPPRSAGPGEPDRPALVTLPTTGGLPS